jgi:RNA polymerase sigma factor (sigma-70 family)
VRAWLRRSSYRFEDEDDLIQEAYSRIAGIDPVGITSGRRYFFVTVRNLVLEQMRRARIVRIDAVAEVAELNIVEDGPDPEAAASSRQELAIVKRLIDGLPERCRQIFMMRKVQGLPQRDIARALRVTENIVEKEAGKGLRLILDALALAGQGMAAGRPQRGWNGHDGARSRPGSRSDRR